MQNIESFTADNVAGLAIKIENYLKKHPGSRISSMAMSEVLGYGNSMSALVCFEV